LEFLSSPGFPWLTRNQIFINHGVLCYRQLIRPWWHNNLLKSSHSSYAIEIVQCSIRSWN
jgi:hypothetical protein